MPDNLDRSPTLNATSTKLRICFFSAQQQLSDAVSKLLDSSSYKLVSFDTIKDWLDFAIDNYEQIDCLVLSCYEPIDSIGCQLRAAEVFLPVIIVSAAESVDLETEDKLVAYLTDTKVSYVYHQAEIRLYTTQLKEVASYVSLAIDRFIRLIADEQGIQNISELESAEEKTLISQQRRLTEKLKGRLSYLGFFCKRNPDRFWSNLPQPQQKELTERIAQRYRQILLLYFESDSEINKIIDDFVDRAFFADISTSQILEIHMATIDDFAYQLKIEGRSDDILLDYRLPLIDIIAHLCEMYRRSIPGSDGSMNLPFALE